MRKVLAILLPLLLTLTACGGMTTDDVMGGSAGNAAGATEILDSVTVSGGSDEEPPTVEFDPPLDITGVAAKTVVEGDGDEVQAGERVTYQLISLNAEDGEVLGDTYSRGEPQPLPVDDTLKEQDAELYDVLVGTKVGAQVAYTRPVDAAAEGQPATPQQLIVFRIISSEELPPPPPEPEILSPEGVQKLDDDGQLPTFTFDDDGAPAVSIPDNEPSDDLVVKVLEEGDGETVTEADTITANYTGWTYSDGEKFDSSFDRGEPATFPLSNVIQGWTKGLAGQKVGSKVMLVIPEPWAYPEAGQGSPEGTLVFFVELVGKDSAE
ncbi:peptidylprolyl isomerase [Arthrobacter echini]|uniref:peptidylprolyl isomerase n=1 Tax=Arthrobacter echini TaxID=1529066 RepID=A0A5D0XS09_9MICC|nr:FKBP-type peptidyl-prolyl cis-trans isomerase [Arthrobacter echini]TYC99335.1 peptidylprolyl isomerase [Arthrobacter echini]